MKKLTLTKAVLIVFIVLTFLIVWSSWSEGQTIGTKDQAVKVHSIIRAQCLQQSLCPDNIVGEWGWFYFLPTDRPKFDRHGRALYGFNEDRNPGTGTRLQEKRFLLQYVGGKPSMLIPDPPADGFVGYLRFFSDEEVRIWLNLPESAAGVKLVPVNDFGADVARWE